MKAWQIAEFGIDQLQHMDCPDPEPGPGQVLVRMKAWSLNYRDLMVVRGEYNPKLRRPIVPLSDGAGEVVACGSDVTRVAPGDRVAGAFMQKWIDHEPDEAALRSALGGSIDGVAAEYVVFDESGLVRLPEYLTYEEAATLPCAGVTAWHALVTEGQVGACEWVLTQGSGGVSVFALQFAALMDARVVATSSRPEKLERLRAMGAEAGVDYKTTPDWDKAAREITGGSGVDHVVEVGGSGTLTRSMRAVRPGGKIHVIGVLGGNDEIAFVPLLMRNLRLQGILVGSRAMFEEMLGVMDAHEVRPVVDRTFSFGELPQALHAMAEAQHFGKIVLSA
ncbi:MAG TPA: NAD(P)-dependent alcohol dehydrogenase [Bryobacteraceae bacterium]|nr:NAD(P)-dependent alcohol dehydrogenase [Bryobacteraceae bacterium]